MRAEILAIGTELLLGEIVDTNSAWLAADLAGRGVDVYWSQRVGDNRARIAEAVRQGLGRSDLLITVGGLGPTADDLTREGIADALGETPAVDPDLEAALRAWFAERGHPMPAMNVKQAWRIPSASSLPNPLGTAPGWLSRAADRSIVSLPGPPAEMQRMWSEEAAPRLAFPTSVLWRRSFKTWGLGESRVAEMLGDWTERANPSVATYAKADGVQVRVAAQAETAEAAAALAAPAVQAVERALADHIWGHDDDRLADRLRARLEAEGRRLATIESLTGGLLGHELASVPGISGVYCGGGIAYSAVAKERLGVPSDVIARHGTVSAETAAAMALAAARFFGSDYALATTGVAGPDVIEGKPVGTVFVAAHGPQGTQTRALDLGDRGRQTIRERATCAALFLLWKILQPA